MDVSIDRSSAVPLYRQISRSLKAMILSGRLPEGFRLPPERRLSQALGVNRSTVLQAYDELKSDGLVDAHVGRGTTVLTRPAPAAPADTAAPLLWRQMVRDTPPSVRDPLLRDLLELSERGDVISLSVGLPAPEELPLSALAHAHEGLLAELGPAFVLHSPTEGVTVFREALASLLAARGIHRSTSEVLVTSGSQQALDLLARAFLDPGDEVVVEEPSFFGALQAFRAAGARLIGVPADREGLRMDALEAVLTRHRPKLVYTLPTFQNPSGVVQSLARRRQLLELAYRFQVPVVEDDPYSDLRYEGEPLPSLAALDVHSHVIYLSSFSKVLFPGLRVGFLTAPRALVRHLALVKQSMDLHSSTPGQWLIHRLLVDGTYATHLTVVRQAYRRRRDVMLAALAELAPEGLGWERPEGGFYVWCQLPAGVSQGRLLARAAEASVSFLPGSACFVDEPAEPFIRLTFTHAPEALLATGVERLMGAVHLATEPRTGADRPDAGTRPIV